MRRLLLATLLAFALCATPALADSYVSLGDSYVAGPFIPLPTPQPWGCLKSDHNYAHLAAPRLGLDLRDPSCTGAETGDMTQTPGVSPGPNPPQFDALAADTTLVTLGIGGNDIGFASIAEDCFSDTPQRRWAPPAGDSTAAGLRRAGDGGDKPAARDARGAEDARGRRQRGRRRAGRRRDAVRDRADGHRSRRRCLRAGLARRRGGRA